VIELEAIVEPEKGVEYPHIVTKRKSRSKKSHRIGKTNMTRSQMDTTPAGIFNAR
jgi:hypothetical protein